MSRRKTVKPVVRVRWIDLCPVCGEPGRILGGCWRGPRGHKAYVHWTCEACAAKLVRVPVVYCPVGNVPNGAWARQPDVSHGNAVGGGKP